MSFIRPIRSWSIRWRLTAWYAVTSLVVLLLAGTIAYSAFRATFIHNTDRALTIKGMEVIYSAAGSELLHRSNRFLVPPLSREKLIENFRNQFASEAYDPLGDPIYMRLLCTEPTGVTLLSHNINQHGLVQKTLGAQIDLPPSQTVAGSFRGSSEYNELRVLEIRIPRQPFVLQLATPWERYEDTLQPMVNVIAAVIAFGFALSAIGGWILVSQTLQPITEIVNEASKMSGQRLEPSFVAARTRTDDEIGHLVSALNDMMGRVQQAIECQRRFTADASHDLKTPLAILHGEMELALARERSSEQYREVLASGLEETDRLIRIVSDLRELAKADFDNEHRLHRTAINLNELVVSVLSSRKTHAAIHNVELVLVAPDDSDRIIVLGDSVSIERAIDNLVDNAINYNNSPGNVEIQLTRDDQSAMIRVSDTGIGIDPDDRPHIFDRFYRGDKSRSGFRTNDGVSTGLGLAIVKSVVTVHGGAVTVYSEAGKGCVFTISLPLANFDMSEEREMSMPIGQGTS